MFSVVIYKPTIFFLKKNLVMLNEVLLEPTELHNIIVLFKTLNLHTDVQGVV